MTFRALYVEDGDRFTVDADDFSDINTIRFRVTVVEIHHQDPDHRIRYEVGNTFTLSVARECQGHPQAQDWSLEI